MMTEIEAIKSRHSVRNYEDKKIESEKVAKLIEKLDELNKEGNLHLQFVENAGSTYNKLLNKAMGLGSAPSVIACVGPEDATVDERVGYYGEQFVLFAQQLGLNTCWAATFNRKNIAAEISDGEKLVISIAIGYGSNQGKDHKSKTIDQVTTANSNRPYWFNYGVEMALLAPTAINQQKFEINYDHGDVSFKDKGGVMSKVDLGIVKCHFEIGSEYIKSQSQN